MSLNQTITIDPGLHTCWAYWSGTKYPLVGEFHVYHKLQTPEGKIADLCEKLEDTIFEKQISRAYIEGVEIYRMSLKSMIAATRGNLSLLSYIVGAYFDVLRKRGITVEIISPKWKGNLNYKQLAVWVQRSNGWIMDSEHQLSAVGMGLKIGGNL